MILEDIMDNINVLALPLEKSGAYDVKVSGKTPDGESVSLEIELTECYSEEVLADTLRSKLEEIFSCKYQYVFGSYDPEDTIYDGGNFT